MVNSIKLSVVSMLLVGTILVAGCSVSPSKPATPAVETSAQTVDQPSAPSSSQLPSEHNAVSEQGASDNITSVAEEPQSSPPNRVDVIYFHVNQRCVTCLCFEQRINHVVEADFSDAISSGKMTYRVLNAQQQQNADIARKYGAVGSQLCINMVIDGQDNIENIIDIWKWDCRYNASNFDRHVRNVIEDSLEKIQ
ncbi:MAG: nitrophenyl compound nitroreductase subunit ArsF family protein [Dehalococcoidia bacterium]|nr:nitrophenyl compound nitroreductase subunit ArsF family protein [Dehalococcoidia bacterium]